MNYKEKRIKSAILSLMFISPQSVPFQNVVYDVSRQISSTSQSVKSMFLM